MQNRTVPKMFPMPQHLRFILTDEEREIRGTLRAISKTVSEVLLSGDDPVRSICLNIKGEDGTKSSFNLHGKMIGTGWKTNIFLAQDGNMISLAINLPRGRYSYRTDILAKSVTEEVTRAYAEHALIQLLRKNNREDALTQILEQKR